MRIGIDAGWMIYEDAGVGKYSYNLIKAILNTDLKNRYILFFTFLKDANKRIDYIYDLANTVKNRPKIKISRLPVALRQKLLDLPLPPNLIFNEKIDLFFSPYFAGLPKKPFPKMVTTIHDLAFKKYPEHPGKKLSAYYTAKTHQAIKDCKEIIAVSESTRRDLVTEMGADPLKVEVIYEGLNDNFLKIAKNFKPANLPKKKYILSVCTLEPRKNLERLLKAYADLPYSFRQNYQLVLVGKKGWNNKNFFATLQDLNLKDDIFLPGFIPDKELPYWYKNAEVFVYPSLYEGFGLPVLEALACGTPVICSNTSSLPEIVGKAGILIDPKKEEQISSALKDVLTNPKLAYNLRKRGYLQAKKFRWEKAAKETVNLFEKLV